VAKKTRFVSLISTASLLSPLVVFAQSGATIEHVLTIAKDIFGNYLAPLLMTIAIAVFIYGVVKYIAAAGDTDKMKEAKGYIIYGILGLFVLVAFWGLIAVLVQTFGLDAANSPIELPPAPYL